VDYILLRPPFYEEVGRRPRMSAEQKRELVRAFERESQARSAKVRVLVDRWVSDADALEVQAGGESPRRGRWIGPGANGIEHITGRCLASPLLAVVAADGQVYPCCNLRAMDEWALGRIDYARGDSFEAIWKGDRRRQVMQRIRRIECIRYCTHPMSRYNEVVEYLRSPRFHKGFV
jgi:radical SAM protein with 4Fe4S-binding SPASM domain